MPFLPILINFIIGVVLSVASTLLQQAFAPKKAEQQRQTGARGSTMFGGKVPQYFLVGTVGEAGKREYPRKQWGTAGGVPNAYNVDVLSFGDLPITALTRIAINGVWETISGSGHVEQGYPSTGDKAGLFWVEFFDGTQTTASTYLVSKFGTDPDMPWTSGMIGRGIPYITATSLWNGGKWAGFPDLIGEFQGIPLYDPRFDDTAGGNGDQRWDDPSTWAFSDNNLVIAYNIERGIYYDGAHVWGGKKSAAQLPYDVWAAAMDACDEAVALEAGGTEKRFRAGRRIGLNERPADVEKELLIGANARRCETADGTVYVLVGVPSEADGAFGDADILASEPLGSIPFPNLDEVINGATATYREPAQAWEDKETAPYLRTDLEDEDDGRQQIEGLDLGTTFSGTQAQRILKAVIEEGRRFRRHVVALPPEFAIYRPLSVLAWTSDRFDYAAKLFLVTARTISPWGQVVLGLQEIDPADHDWDPEADERPLTFAPVVTNRPAAQEVTGEFVEPASGKDEDGGDRRPGYRVHWSSTSVAVDVEFVRMSHRLKGETTIRWRGLVPRPELLLGEAEVYEALLPDQRFEVQIEYVPPASSGRETVASNWMEVLIPNIKLGAADIEIDLEDVAQELIPILAPLQQGMRSLIEAYKTFGTLLEESDRENFNKREALSRSLQVQLGNIIAGFDEVIETAVGPDGAIGIALSTLYAAMGGNTSEVNVAWQVRAAPSGYAARYAINAAVNDGTFRAGTFLIDVPSNPLLPVRIVLDADQTVITSNGGATVNALFTGGGAFIDNAWITDLTADNIRVKSLDADAVLIDGSTVTELIAANAITNVGASAASTDVNITSGTAGNTAWVTIASLTVTPKGGDMVIMGSVSYFGRLYDGLSYGMVQIRVRKAGVEVLKVRGFYSYLAFLDGQGVIRDLVVMSGAAPIYRDTSPGTAAVTYDIQIHYDDSLGGPYAGIGTYLTVGAGSGLVGINLKR